MYLSGYRYLCDAVTLIGVKVCKTVDLSSGHKVSRFGGDAFRVTKCEIKMERWSSDCEYLGKSQRYMSSRA